MNILRKTAAALLSCTMILTMAGCAAEPEEETVPKPEDIPETALVVDYLAWPWNCPTPCMPGWASRSSPAPIRWLPRMGYR